MSFSKLFSPKILSFLTNKRTFLSRPQILADEEKLAHLPEKKKITVASFLHPKLEEPLKPFGNFGQFYLICVGGATLYGGGKGLFKWFDWITRREYINLGNGDLNDIIGTPFNISRDAGMLGWYILFSSAMSFFITSTSPVSVPLIYIWNQSRNREKNENPVKDL